MAFDLYSDLDKFEGAFNDEDSSSGYDSIQGDDLLSDTRLLKDLRYVYENDIDNKIAADASDEELIDHWYSDMRAKSANTISAGFDMYESSQAEGELAAARSRVDQAFQRAPDFRGGTLSTIGEYLAYGAMDPLNYIPGYAVGKNAFRGAFVAARNSGKSYAEARQIAQQALRSKKTLAKQVGADAAVNAGIGGTMDTIQQLREQSVAGEDAKDFDFGRVAQAAALDGTIGAAISAPVSMATRGLTEKNVTNEMKQELRNNGQITGVTAPRGGVTITELGGEPVEPVATPLRDQIDQATGVSNAFDNNPVAQQNLDKQRFSLVNQLEDLREQYADINERLKAAKGGDESRVITQESIDLAEEIRSINDRLRTYDALELQIDALRKKRNQITKALTDNEVAPEQLEELQLLLEQTNDEIALTQQQFDMILNDDAFVPQFTSSAPADMRRPGYEADMDAADALRQQQAEEAAANAPQIAGQLPAPGQAAILLPENLPDPITREPSATPMADDITTPVIRENIPEAPPVEAAPEAPATPDVEVTAGAQKLIDQNEGLTVDMITGRNKGGKITQREVRIALKDPNVADTLSRMAAKVTESAPENIEVQATIADELPNTNTSVAETQEDLALMDQATTAQTSAANPVVDEAVDMFGSLLTGDDGVRMTPAELRSMLNNSPDYDGLVDEIIDRISLSAGDGLPAQRSVNSFDQLGDLLGIDKNLPQVEKNKEFIRLITDGGIVDLSEEANQAVVNAVTKMSKEFSEGGDLDIPAIPVDVLKVATEDLPTFIRARRARIARSAEYVNKSTDTVDAVVIEGATRNVEQKIKDALAKNVRTTTRKSMNALENDTQAGRSPKRVPNQETGQMEWRTTLQSFLRQGRDVGDGYTVTGNLANFSRGAMELDLLRTTISSLKKQGKDVAPIVKFKVKSPIKTDQAAFRTKEGRTFRANATLTPGATGYYVPYIDKVFTDYKSAEAAAGIAKVQSKQIELNYEVPSPTNAVEFKEAIGFVTRQLAGHRDLARFAREKKQVTEAYKASLKDSPEVGPSAVTEQQIASGNTGVPVKRGNMRLALFPKDPNKTYAKGRRITPRVISDRQIANGATVETLGGKTLDDFHIGYVPDEFANRAKAGDIDTLREVFEPIDDTNRPISSEQAAQELANSRPAPLNFEQAVEKKIGISSLSQPEMYAFADALQMTGRSNLVKSVASFKASEFDLVEVNRLINDVESLPWSASDFDGAGIAYARRLNTLNRLNEVLTREAPGGLRGDTETIGKSLDQLKSISGKASAKTITQIGQLLKALRTDVYPKFQRSYDEGVAGQFLINKQAGRVTDQNGDNMFNSIQLKTAEELSDFENGDLGHAFATLHELGHWVWQNVMLPEDKAMFWEATGKFYDDNGDLLPSGAREIIKKSPISMGKDGSIIGYSNAADNPMEYFANQFALYVSNQREMVSIADKTMWDRMIGIVRELWNKITGKEIVDKDLIPLFARVVRDDTESARITFSNPVEPTSDYGKIIRARFGQLNDVRNTIKGIVADGDYEGAVDSLRDLSSRLMSMAATKQDGKKIARALGEDYRTDSTGSFGPIRMYAPAMRQLAQRINQVVGDRAVEINADTGEAMSIVSPQTASDIENLINNETFRVKAGDVTYKIGFNDLLDDVLNQMNTVYRNKENGDIPEWSSPSVEQFKIRRGKIVKPGSKRGSPLWRRNYIHNKKVKAEKAKAAAEAKELGLEKQTASEKDRTPPKKKAGIDVSSLKTDALITRFSGEKDKATRRLLAKEIKQRINVSNKIDITDVLDPKNWKTTRPYKALKEAEIMDVLSNAKNIADKAERQKAFIDASKELKYRQLKKSNASPAKRALLGPSNPVLESAIQAERKAMQDTLYGTGLIENIGFKAREAIQAITHRDPSVEIGARTLLLRMNALGMEFPVDATSPEFSDLRSELRRAASVLAKSDNIDSAIDAVAKMLLRSQAVDSSGIGVIRDIAAASNLSPDDVVSRLLREDLDLTIDNRLVDSLGDVFDSDKLNTLDTARASMVDSANYVMRGLIESEAAGSRYAPLFAGGDPLDASSTRSLNLVSRNKSASSPELMRDYLEDYREIASDEALSRMDEWATHPQLIAERVSRSIDPDDTRPAVNGPLGSGIYLTKPSSYTPDTKSRMMDIIDNATDNDEVYEAANTLMYARDKMKDLRIKSSVEQADNVSSDYDAYTEMSRLQGLEEASIETLRANGVETNLFTAPYAAKAKNIANFGEKVMHKKSVGPVAEMVAVALSSGKVKPTAVLDAINKFPEDITGAEALQLGTQILGSVDEVNTALRKSGYDAIETDEMLVVFDANNAKHVGGSYFNQRTSNYSGQQPSASPVDKAVNGILEGKPLVQAIDESSEMLQQAGVSSAVVSKLKRKALGKPVEFDENDLKEVRQVLTFETNGGILRKAGLSYLAEFFEPDSGAGGHFERVNIQLGKRITPIISALNKLPDVKNGALKRWWNRGFRQMAESVLPLPPEPQPLSHSRIVQSLRTGTTMMLKSKQELQVREQLRNMFNETLDRLRASGVHMGEIQKDNYFPQVWRKDLIESDMETFVEKMANYFQAEHLAREGDQLDGMPRETALSIARKVALKLIDEDGVAPPVNKFSGGGREITLDHAFQRMIRLDKFTDFVDPTNKNDLSQFLENDISVITTKYLDSAERRIEMNDTFGTSSHGFYDYLEVTAGAQSGDMRDRIMSLLTSSKVFRPTRDATDASGRIQMEMPEEIFSSLLPATDEGRETAFVLAQELMDLAAAGRSAKEIEDMLVSTHQGDATQKLNFAKRARAIANALVDTQGGKKAVHPNNIAHAMDFYKTAMRKPISMNSLDEKFRTPSKALRAFNMVTLLSYTAVTSLTDVVLPLINSGDFKAFAKGWKDYALKGPEYREFIAEIGASVENVVHQRMTHTLGTDSSKFANGFFTATMLEPWTTMNREISASIGYNFFKLNQKLALTQPNTRDGRIAKQRLDRYGLSSLYSSTSGKPATVESIMRNDSVARDEIASAIIKFTNEAIFTPNPNDIPVLANTPIGALLFQLKSFPLMMSRLGGRVIRKARGTDGMREYAPLLAFAAIGPAYSAGVVATKDLVQARNEDGEGPIRERRWNDGVGSLPFVPEVHEDLDAMMGWYADGMLQMGGLGLLGDVLYNTAEQIDNGAYGRERIASTFLGPTFGLAMDSLTVGEGILDGNDSSNAKERAATREILQRIPILGGRRDVRESLVDDIAGESSKKKNRTAMSGVYSFGYDFGYEF